MGAAAQSAARRVQIRRGAAAGVLQPGRGPARAAQPVRQGIAEGNGVTRPIGKATGALRAKASRGAQRCLAANARAARFASGGGTRRLRDAIRTFELGVSDERLGFAEGSRGTPAG